jgi:hypothetical protein
MNLSWIAVAHTVHSVGRSARIVKKNQSVSRRPETGEIGIFKLLLAFWCRGTETPTLYIRRAWYGGFQSGDRRVGPIFWACLVIGILRARCASLGDGTMRFKK